MPDKNIFFDNTSTTPVDPEVTREMTKYLTEQFGNPSAHVTHLGQNALKAVDDAREKVADLICASPDEIIFTSGATEANNLAIKGLARAYKGRGNHILISQIEHYSVLNAARRLEREEGFKVELVPVDDYGVIKLDELKKMLRPDTILVSIMTANTEIGTIEPIKDAVMIVREYNPAIIFHTDAASAAGWIPIDTRDLYIDAMTMSAHNFYGPKGVGALYLRKNVNIEPLFDGGFQERGIRSGTENVPGIVGMGFAAELAKEHMNERIVHLQLLQKKLKDGLKEKLKFMHFTGHPEKRLPGHVSFWIEHAEGESILLFLQVKGIMAASGSACSSNLRAADEHEMIKSHVLEAVGVPQDICAGSITFFMGKDNTEEEVDYVVNTMPEILERLWAMSPAYADMLKEAGS